GHELLGSSLAMRKIRPIIEGAAKNIATVLISGENGTGKEFIAKQIHLGGRRRSKPFIAINCGALAEGQLEAERFGILANSATGVHARIGKFREAHGGTLFLDEIGEMPLRHQVALLRVIATREVTPIGGARATKVDVRIIAATNRDLKQRIQSGQFREDL